jgi:hypothetical protein
MDGRLSMHSLRHSFASMLATDLELPATTLARLTGYADAGARAYVYEHAGELGVIPMGNGKRPRLRFDLEQAIACYTSRRSSGPDSAQAKASPRRRRRPLGRTVELLPIHGRIPRGRGSREAA